MPMVSLKLIAGAARSILVVGASASQNDETAEIYSL
jgi:hypothetical protein